MSHKELNYISNISKFECLISNMCTQHSLRFLFVFVLLCLEMLSKTKTTKNNCRLCYINVMLLHINSLGKSYSKDVNNKQCSLECSAEL